MDILICAREKDAPLIFENVKSYFSREYPDAELSWKRSGSVFTTSLDTGEEKITRVFEVLVKSYPQLDVQASYAYDIREDDTSAQWWGITKIYSITENGETKIVSSSSTYWN